MSTYIRQKCKHCEGTIQQVNFILGQQWMHIDPNASFPTIQKGTMWEYCKRTVAEPEEIVRSV
jgi:hypothetical protein